MVLVMESKITVKHVELMLDILLDIDSVEYLFYGDALDEEDFMNQIKDNIEWLQEVRIKLMESDHRYCNY